VQAARDALQRATSHCAALGERVAGGHEKKSGASSMSSSTKMIFGTQLRFVLQAFCENESPAYSNSGQYVYAYII